MALGRRAVRTSLAMWWQFFDGIEREGREMKTPPLVPTPEA